MSRRLLLLIGVLMTAFAVAQANAQEVDAVSEVQKALRSQAGRQWYDGAADDVRHFKVRVPKPPKATAPVAPSKQRTPVDWSGTEKYIEAGFWAIAAFVLGLLGWYIAQHYLRKYGWLKPRGKVVKTDLTSRVVDLSALPTAIEQEPETLLDSADADAAAGDYRSAMIKLYSHELIELDAASLVRLDKSKTNRRYVRELSGKAELQQYLQMTVAAFERVYFGGKQLAPEEYQACRSGANEFPRLIAREVAAT